MNQDPSSVPQGLSRSGGRTNALPRAVEGERRVITILFCDVVGSTNLASQLDPEEWAEVMNEAFQYMIAPIEEYDGTVARLMGDAVLAFFGAPHAHEDDPQRAVLAGLGIVKGIQGFAQRFQDEYGLEFGVRVGINTGPVVVGEIGSQLNQEYTAMGDAINLAARMEQTAIAGTVQISEDTHRQVAPFFDTWDIGPVEVKGKDEPVQAYRVLGVEPQPGRRRGIEGLAAPVVGRERELARLNEIIDEVRAGQSHVLFLIGEAGLGKTRLIAEAREMWRATARPDGPEAGRQSWTEFVAASYGASRPYDMLRRQIRQAGGIREADDAAAVEQRLEALAAVYPPDLRSRMIQAYGYLLDESGKVEEGSGESFQRELHTILREATAHLAQAGPVVYAVDDLHWADVASIAALSRLLPLVETEPVLYLFAMRPDWNSAAWQFYMQTQQSHNAYCSAIFLEPLAPADSRQLIATMLEGAGAPEGLFDLVQQKAEGNPYYIEEVVRALIDSGTLIWEDEQLRWRPSATLAEVEALMSLPGNVQSLLTARFDRLDKEAQRILQMAAVIGRTFPVRVLEQLAGDLDLDAHLKRLVQSDLIRQTATTPEPEYTFVHALTRDAAYETILFRQRRRIHRQVGEAFETLYAQRLAEEASRIAYQFAEGRDWSKAITYYTMAGTAATRLYANDEALEQFDRAIEVALAAPSRSVDDDVLVDLHLRRGRVLEVSGRHAAAQETYRTLGELGASRNNDRMVAAALVAEAALLVTPTPLADPVQGQELAERSLALAETHGFEEIGARANWALMLLQLNALSDPQAAISHGEAALAVARELEHRELEAYVVNDIGRAYFAAGSEDYGFTHMQEAHDLWKALGNQVMQVDCLSTWSHGLFLAGRLREAAERGEEGVTIAKQIGSDWGWAYSAASLGASLIELGRMGPALAELSQALEIARRTGLDQLQDTLVLLLHWYQLRVGVPDVRWSPPQWSENAPQMVSHEPALARLWPAVRAMIAGDNEAALENLGPDLLRFDVARSGQLPPLAVWLQARVALRSGDYNLALRWLEEGMAYVAGKGVEAYLGDLHVLMGDAHRAKEQPDEARAAWQEAERIARTQGARHTLLAALARQGLHHDDPAAARAMLSEASQLAGSIAASFDSLQLRATYLSQPWLAPVLQTGGPER